LTPLVLLVVLRALQVLQPFLTIANPLTIFQGAQHSTASADLVGGTHRSMWC
jgi:hypothetical protein